MRTLPKEITKFGYLLQECCCNKKGLKIYKAYEGKKHSGWFVAKVKILPKTTFPNGAEYPKREALPSRSEGGSLIWFFMPDSFKQASEQFAKLNKEVRDGVQG